MPRVVGRSEPVRDLHWRSSMASGELATVRRRSARSRSVSPSSSSETMYGASSCSADVVNRQDVGMRSGPPPHAPHARTARRRLGSVTWLAGRIFDGNVSARGACRAHDTPRPCRRLPSGRRSRRVRGELPPAVTQRSVRAARRATRIAGIRRNRQRRCRSKEPPLQSGRSSTPCPS